VRYVRPLLKEPNRACGWEAARLDDAPVSIKTFPYTSPDGTALTPTIEAFFRDLHPEGWRLQWPQLPGVVMKAGKDKEGRDKYVSIPPELLR
jgi:hypothetical protein